LNPNSLIEAHMRSTAASFFLGFRMYGTNRSIGHTSVGVEVCKTEVSC
jgi:hypothetical protein